MKLRFYLYADQSRHFESFRKLNQYLNPILPRRGGGGGGALCLLKNHAKNFSHIGVLNFGKFSKFRIKIRSNFDITKRLANFHNKFEWTII